MISPVISPLATQYSGVRFQIENRVTLGSSTMPGMNRRMTAASASRFPEKRSHRLSREYIRPELSVFPKTNKAKVAPFANFYL